VTVSAPIEQLEQMNQEFTGAVERAFRSGGESFFAASRTYDVRQRRWETFTPPLSALPMSSAG
jgi:hypothetical protein